MSVALVDTSIVVDVLINAGPNRDRASKALERFAEIQLPVYAIKEFQAGALGGVDLAAQQVGNYEIHC